MTIHTLMPSVTIYTDGGCSPNPGLGGYAAILVSGSREKVITGAEPDTTGYRMELMAAVAGLEALTKPARITLVSDNNNLVKGMNQWLPGWVDNNWLNSRNKPIAHADLWQRIHTAVQTHDVTAVKVKAHVAAGHASEVEQMNNRADTLVAQARDNYDPDADSSPTTTDSASTLQRNYRLYIAGSRRTNNNMRQYAQAAVNKAIENGWTIVVGDNPQGIDSVVVHTANQMEYSDVIVVGIASQPRNGGISGGQYIQYGTRYNDRDKAMARASDRGLFIWNGWSGGTRQAYTYMKNRQKTAHLIDFNQTFQRA